MPWGGDLKAKRPTAAFVSGRELARQAKCSHTAVQLWAKAGEIDARPDGKFPRAASLKAIARIRAELDERDEERGALAKVRSELATARRDLARANARIRAVEADRVEGRFVDVETVRADATAYNGQVIAGLRSLAARTAAAVEAALVELADGPVATRTVRVEAVIDEEVNRLLESLQPSAFVAPSTRAA